MRLTYLFTPIDMAIFNYPKWKHLVAESPTEDEFLTAWRLLYEWSFYECKVQVSDAMELFGNNIGCGAVIQTPDTEYMDGRFLLNYTDEPVLSEDQTFYYDVGTTWDTDLLGQRFCKISPETMWPVKFDEVLAHETINRYLNINKHLLP